MTIGIIAAMAEELEILLKDLSLEQKKEKANMTFHKGKLYGQDVVAVVCGIGKVNSAVCRIGKDIYPGDIVVAENLVQHDMDTSVFGDKIGQIPRLDTFDFKCDSELISLAKKSCEELSDLNSFTGRIASGDQFVANIEKIQWLDQEFGAISCEMEGASIAQVCYLNSVPFVVIRSISDNANNGAHMDYEKFVPIAVQNSTKILKRMLEMM
ncbi:MAG: 5'-methylthioadenosine/adenosylhomocysteine nucleosidase [Clostridium sp.]|uniref:5'-methylthioadenosine/adenosylhomocysteine nucleosidase n=1 Tax=Clostridium sp. TaxID=1506 RepID=UPI0028FE3FD0|nr:5'-methylthioadenosine/adenosylhomocysteine nucleosidase [Clostridium sp.]MDU1605476.1 5'-methylthioadenosine/adenosylhomocysteine nucleosidase [Clostridium sp.]